MRPRPVASCSCVRMLYVHVRRCQDWTMDDWSIAAFDKLHAAYDNISGTPALLRSFSSSQGVEITQPTLSRVHHIGSLSSIGYALTTQSVR